MVKQVCIVMRGENGKDRLLILEPTNDWMKMDASDIAETFQPRSLAKLSILNEDGSEFVQVPPEERAEP